ncbi:MmgE/PrpD family protein [Pseudonocardia kujensis]|uniref:MmgE/PrpD family protein n=1 Tax=Pseudonocardia kujensis TaxID=1128675 RepID=UPI001E2C8D94|nr:MmgE/PrpD family protein [Pseudonocardia kujensis]MCE0763687.1 MmgE/PrpD family protein [Pseudonocardia kujensis]
MTATLAETARDTASARIARWTTGLTLADIPAPVRAVARDHLLDATGTALAAAGTDFGQAVHTAGTRLGAGTEAHALGYGTPLPAASAALVNGTLMHGLDFDDTHIGAIYHASGPALAAALAVGEAEGASGAAVLTAYVIGLEVGCRLAAAGAGEFHARGFHPTGIAGTFAAACVAAHLRGLDPDTLTSALGLCGSQAAGILEIQGSWLKRMHPGWAAHAGLVAVTMAEAGFRGPAAVLEGSKGLYAAHLGRVPEDLGLDDLGERWWTPEIALKPYPCCHFTHAFADAAFAVLDELGRDRIGPEEVVKVVCPTSVALIPAVVEPVAAKTAPATTYDALFSVQYVAATALVRRRVDLAVFYDEPLDDPAVLAMAAKVECPPDPLSDYPAHFPGEVELHLADGRVVRHRVPASHGTPEWALGSDQVRQKFLANARRRIGEQQAVALAEAIDTFEAHSALGSLLELTWT